MQSVRNIAESISPVLWLAIVLSATTVVALRITVFQSKETKAKRLEVKRQKELLALTENISAYARTVHKQFPTGDVVVSERDLAEQLRNRTEMVVAALNLLLSEKKVQRAPLSGYWKLDG